MRTKLLILASAGLAIMLSCVSTTSVEAPAEADPNQIFEVTVHTELTEQYGGDMTGLLAVLVPSIWTVDSVFCDGYGYTGPFVFSYSDSMYYWPSVDEEALRADLYKPATGYIWWVFAEDSLYGDLGETAHAAVFVTTNDSLGQFQMAFLAAVTGQGNTNWNGDPCSCIVEVTPLQLEQETWGYIKSEF